MKPHLHIQMPEFQAPQTTVLQNITHAWSYEKG